LETTIEANLVQKVLESDRRIRFAGIIDETGKLVKGGMRQGKSPLEPTKKDEDKLYLKWFLIQAMTDEWDTFLGNKILLYIRHEKVDLYGIPLRSSRILLVSCEQIREPHFFGDKLLQLVDRACD
jgi:hypothetical protein